MTLTKRRAALVLAWSLLVMLPTDSFSDDDDRRLLDTAINNGVVEPLQVLLAEEELDPLDVCVSLTRQTDAGLSAETREQLLYEYLSRFFDASDRDERLAPALTALHARWRLLTSAQLRGRVIRLTAIELGRMEYGTRAFTELDAALKSSVVLSATWVSDALRGGDSTGGWNAGALPDHTPATYLDAHQVAEALAICRVAPALGSMVLSELLLEIATAARNRAVVDAANEALAEMN